MSISSVERVKQIMEMRTMQVCAPLIEQGEFIEKCTSWFCNEESREQYKRELSFKALYALTNEQSAIHYAGNLPLQRWQAVIQEAKARLAAGLLPDLDMQDIEEYWKLYTLGATYILEQYKYAPYVDVKDGDIVLDCGGCFADTAIWFAQCGAQKVYSFEPPPKNGESFCKNVQRMGFEDAIALVPYALGQENGEISFAQSQSNPAASRQSEQGDIRVPVTSIDIWCEANAVKPDFIKMDIEGAECDAIIGAQNTIRTHKPRLAICLYHQLSDMWNIPYLLKQICPEYRFWCRKNAHVGEFVLYASVEN